MKVGTSKARTISSHARTEEQKRSIVSATFRIPFMQSDHPLRAEPPRGCSGRTGRTRESS